MRRANAFPALVVQSVIALALGASATVLVQLAGKTATTIVLGLLLALFFFALLTPLRAGAMWRWCGPGGRFGFRRRGGGPRDGVAEAAADGVACASRGGRAGRASRRAKRGLSRRASSARFSSARRQPLYVSRSQWTPMAPQIPPASRA